MNPSRLVAGIAALAIGFAVTLAGVAISDDATTDDSTTTDEVMLDSGAPNSDDSIELGDTDDGNGAIEEALPAEEPADAEVIGSLPGGTVELPPLDGDVEPAVTAPDPQQDNDDQLDDGQNDDEPDRGNPDRGEPDVAILDEVRCVETISVVWFDGLITDFVVLEQRGASAWLVLEVDGAFVISADDFDVSRVVELDRSVVFFQETPIEFLDTCDEVGGTSADAGLDLGGLVYPDAAAGDRTVTVSENNDRPCSDAKICPQPSGPESDWNGDH